MTVFVYDKTFEGLLTAVLDAYSRRSFPDLLLAEGEPFPLFYDEAVTICTDDAKVDRVWKGLQKRLSAMALSVITVTWLSELPETDMLLKGGVRCCFPGIQLEEKLCRRNRYILPVLWEPVKV